MEDLRAADVKTVLALRGDLVDGQQPADFRYACELIPRLKEAELCVGAAAYPEGHIDCLDPRENIRHLRAKQDAGADFFITQLFFNNDDFYRFRRPSSSCWRNTRTTRPPCAKPASNTPATNWSTSAATASTACTCTP